MDIKDIIVEVVKDPIRNRFIIKLISAGRFMELIQLVRQSFNYNLKMEDIAILKMMFGGVSYTALRARGLDKAVVKDTFIKILGLLSRMPLTEEQKTSVNSIKRNFGRELY